jgi:hypothetical protein
MLDGGCWRRARRNRPTRRYDGSISGFWRQPGGLQTHDNGASQLELLLLGNQGGGGADFFLESRKGDDSSETSAAAAASWFSGWWLLLLLLSGATVGSLVVGAFAQGHSIHHSCSGFYTGSDAPNGGGLCAGSKGMIGLYSGMAVCDSKSGLFNTSELQSNGLIRTAYNVRSV